MGCQMNARDSEKLRGILLSIGAEETAEEKADLVIYNTCCIRENAEQKVYGRLGYLKSVKRKNPGMKIALCGCMMQEDAVIEKIRKSYPEVDLIFGTYNLYKFPELLENVLESDSQINDIWDKQKEIVEDLPSVRKSSFKASVNIMYGCDNFCTYCIVPYVRGRERSRKPENILAEIKSLAQSGVREIQLLGQNVNSYGKGLENPISFAKLLEMVQQVDGIERIRFMTSPPKDLSDELIDVMAESGHVCHQFHLPLQSGSSYILERMNRHYDKARFLDRAARLKEAIPDISISTDIIVGFPGETEEDFLETLDVVRQIRFDAAFTFIYSKREGTPAASYEDQVDPDVIKERFDRLLALQNRITAENLEKLKGEVLPVLFEEVSDYDPLMISGKLENSTTVHVPADIVDQPSLIGTIRQVRLEETHGFYYSGHIAD